jgi:hypothetical protein
MIGSTINSNMVINDKQGMTDPNLLPVLCIVNVSLSNYLVSIAAGETLSFLKFDVPGLYPLSP